MSNVIEENLKFVGCPDYSEKDQEVAKAIQKEMGVKETGYDKKILDTELSSQPVSDSSEYSWFAPIAFLNIALSPSADVGWHSWTSARFAGSDVGKKVLETVGKVLALTGYDLIENTDIIEKAKKELLERLDGKTYETLLPEDAVPDLTTNKDIMDKFKK